MPAKKTLLFFLCRTGSLVELFYPNEIYDLFSYSNSFHSSLEKRLSLQSAIITAEGVNFIYVLGRCVCVLCFSRRRIISRAFRVRD